MKLIVLLLFLPSILFSQSIRKVNKQLNQQLSERKIVYDSLFTLYEAELIKVKKAMDSLTFHDRIKSAYGSSYSQVEETISSQRRKFSLLCFSNFDTLVMNSYHQINDSIAGIFHDFTLCEYRFYSRFGIEFDVDFEEISRKKQNNLLKERLPKIEKRSNQLKESLTCYETVNREIIIAKENNKKVIQIIKELAPTIVQLQKENEKLLDSLKINYAKKGKASFSKEYQSVFPDVFPEKKADELRTEEILAFDGGPETMAEYPGGSAALKNYIFKNLVFPKECIETIVVTKIYAMFKISSEGKVVEVKFPTAEKDHLNDCPEFLENLKKLFLPMPDWKPAEVDGFNIESWMSLPINIDLK